MIVYLASPQTQQQAEHVSGMPVLLSYALVGKRDWLDKGYQQSFSRILVDSGAYSELNSGVVVDGAAYRDWHATWSDHADAIAGLDDISGDWRRSLKNYEAFGGFPTMHDSDPPELLADLVSIAEERGGGSGLGLCRRETGKSGSCGGSVTTCRKAYISTAGHSGPTRTFAGSIRWIQRTGGATR